MSNFPIFGNKKAIITALLLKNANPMIQPVNKQHQIVWDKNDLKSFLRIIQCGMSCVEHSAVEAKRFRNHSMQAKIILP